MRAHHGHARGIATSAKRTATLETSAARSRPNDSPYSLALATSAATGRYVTTCAPVRFALFSFYSIPGPRIQIGPPPPDSTVTISRHRYVYGTSCSGAFPCYGQSGNGSPARKYFYLLRSSTAPLSWCLCPQSAAHSRTRRRGSRCWPYSMSVTRPNV